METVKKRAFIKKALRSREICEKKFLVLLRIEKDEILKNSKFQELLVSADTKEEAEKFALFNYANYLFNPVQVFPWTRTTTWQERIKPYY